MYEFLVGVLVDELELDVRGIGPDTSCEDAGLDSLALVELSIVLQKRHSLPVSSEELLGSRRVSDIVEILQQRAAA